MKKQAGSCLDKYPEQLHCLQFRSVRPDSPASATNYSSQLTLKKENGLAIIIEPLTQRPRGYFQVNIPPPLPMKPFIRAIHTCCNSLFIPQSRLFNNIHQFYCKLITACKCMYIYIYILSSAY